MGGGYGCELQFECVFGLLLPGGLRIFWCFGICSWDAFGISSLSSLILALFSWGSGSSSFRRRSPCPLLWVDPMDLRLLLITVDLGLKPEATKWVRSLRV